MIFRFIDEHREQWPVRLLCEALDVSPAGYYAWRDRPASARQQRHDALLVQIRAIHAELHARYGSPRVQAELAEASLQVVCPPAFPAGGSGDLRDPDPLLDERVEAQIGVMDCRLDPGQREQPGRQRLRHAREDGG